MIEKYDKSWENHGQDRVRENVFLKHLVIVQFLFYFKILVMQYFAVFITTSAIGFIDMKEGEK